ncbi:carboxymuconolactone decarboxylase family protein [Aureimonas fodinaquatilis]|uniref:Carboxymuconolactone decarboxylase family protein n=1 Tax=Aureimonas fodinaquatilis TaxID=2565783 RepID=A0A5B0E0I9_9HYPH|nr:carboxymuconolactone decarboxylase family protein [Aureimonas fodinaquatilis]KAA0972148.1 carboxymuconolactone decarboxylase family protein [Aureimonas fodinaquatilis]
MPRVPALGRENLPEELRPLWDKMLAYGPFAGQAGVMANRLPVFEHMWKLLTQLSDEAVLDKRYLELAIITVSLVNKCDFCIDQHAPKLAVAGLVLEGVETLEELQAYPALTDVDRLVVNYAIAVSSDWHRIRDQVLEDLRKHFSDAQIVELTWRIALCGAFNRFNDVLQVSA